MSRMIAAVCLPLMFVSALVADKPKENLTAADQFKALVKEYEQVGGPRQFAGKFLELAKKHPKAPVAVDALVWIVTNVRRGNELAGALRILLKDHIKSDKLGTVCQRLTNKPSLDSEKLLRRALAKSPHKKVRAQACLHLAAYLKRQRVLFKALKEQPDPRRFEQFYGKEFTKQLASLDPDQLSKEVERLYERVLKSFADVRINDGTMGETARKELFAIRNLSLGKKAPDIEGVDIDGKRFKLSDYRGKVVLLDFWGHW